MGGKFRKAKQFPKMFPQPVHRAGNLIVWAVRLIEVKDLALFVNSLRLKAVMG
jgi:hypothetical protein